jgi:hypothetical protein
MYGHHGRPIMRYLRTLSDVVSARSLAVTLGLFLASAHRELSVALVQSQGYVYRSSGNSAQERLLCTFAHQGFRAAGVAWSGHSLP